MERKKHQNPVNTQYYCERDFLLGYTIFLGGFKFQLMNADEYTEKYMEDNPELFPQASLNHLITKIKRGAAAHKNLQEYAITLLAKLDKDGNGVLSFKEFTEGLRAMDIFMTNHEEHTLMRKFDHNGDGVVSLEEFYNTLAGHA